MIKYGYSENILPAGEKGGFGRRGVKAMITVSVCMIVKNEEKVLRRCLDSLKEIADELIIVDTGSSDETKAIALEYTDKVFDFEWIDDFSAARNYSFGFATKDYIYMADADEVIDEVNLKKFIRLKEGLDDETEIVQMYYSNQLEHNTTYNYDKEYRPKLFKRVRKFRFIEPVHEEIRLEPVIYNSDIEIEHRPLSNHAQRDFNTFRKAYGKTGRLSERLLNMYAKELMIAGSAKDFKEAEDIFLAAMENTKAALDTIKQCQCVLARGARLNGDKELFFKCALKNVALDRASAEVCNELGEYYYERADYAEAELWYYNAAFETEPELSIQCGRLNPLKKLGEIRDNAGDKESALYYNGLYEKEKAGNVYGTDN